MQSLPGLLFIIFFSACDRNENIPASPPSTDFGEPVRVTITGYSGHIMEPFLSRDGSVLLFNNLNEPSENTNLHWAQKINDSLFLYKGEISGVNTADLEGVPTLDTLGNLFFVSTRNYATTLSTIYSARFTTGMAPDIQLVNGISRSKVPWVNFDVEVSADGQTLYFVDAQLNQQGQPQSADLVVAQKNGAVFQRMANSSVLMANINTSALEYAACISANQLELYFTRVAVPLTANSSPEIFVATRQSRNEPFGPPAKIQAITGFAEGPTISPDQKTLYFHKKDSGRFMLYFVRKK